MSGNVQVMMASSRRASPIVLENTRVTHFCVDIPIASRTMTESSAWRALAMPSVVESHAQTCIVRKVEMTAEFNHEVVVRGRLRRELQETLQYGAVEAAMCSCTHRNITIIQFTFKTCSLSDMPFASFCVSNNATIAPPPMTLITSIAMILHCEMGD